MGIQVLRSDFSKVVFPGGRSLLRLLTASNSSKADFDPGWKWSLNAPGFAFSDV